MKLSIGTSQYFMKVIFSIGLAIILTSCSPNDTEAQKQGFASAAEMKDIQAKGFKSKEDFAKSLGFESISDMNDAKNKGFKTAKEYSSSLGFESYAEMKSLQSKGFTTKAEFDALVLSESTDPLKSCSRSLDSNYDYPINANWQLVRCDDSGRVFVTDIKATSPNRFTVKTIFDTKVPLRYLMEKGKNLIESNANTMINFMEFDCSNKKFRTIGNVTYFSGRMATGQSQSLENFDQTWRGFTHPVAIPNLIKIVCTK